MPSRVTLNDAKRQAWFADLANADVPLQKLSKSVPHGAKGHDLLDLLQSNNVAISRAVWFLRVFGANETVLSSSSMNYIPGSNAFAQAGLRNKPSYNPTQYSLEWANVMTTYMKKQLADIALPSAPRPGLNIKHTFKGVLADADTRERWISRFSYWYAHLNSLSMLHVYSSWQLEASENILSRRSRRQS
jgi:mediator of RNA polymerase II transcription subunit 12, fungi type